MPNGHVVDGEPALLEVGVFSGLNQPLSLVLCDVYQVHARLLDRYRHIE